MNKVDRGRRLRSLPTDLYRDRLRKQIKRNSTINPVTGCWDWNGYKWRNGYGQTRMYGAITPAHRASHFAYTGKDATGLDVCHRCDNRACVNPRHLFLATHLENMRDMIAKGRRVQGRPNPRRGAANKQSIPVIVDGRLFQSRGEAARALGVTKGAVQHRISAGKAISVMKGVQIGKRP